MSRRVPILVCCSQAVANAAAAIPRAALASYFRAWDIELSFRDGPVFPDDPTDDPAAVAALCKKYGPAPGKTGEGLLVIGEMAPEGSGVNGILLDVERRGACAVFAESSVYQNNRKDDRFEVIAHEIGHMLNLVHDEADETFATAMDQWDRRSAVSDRKQVWTNLISSCSPSRQATVNAFYAGGGHSPLGLPMSRTCQDWITGASLGNVLPWGSAFRDSVGGDVAMPGRKALCEISLQDKDIGVGEPIDFRVTVTADPNNEGTIKISRGFGLRDGSLRLTIEDPFGDLRVYVPSRHICVSDSRQLSAGQSVRRSFSLLLDRNGLLFPRKGRYLLRVAAPALGVVSEATQIDVKPARSVFASREFRRFLSAGMPASDSAGWSQVTAAIDDRSISERVRSHLVAERMSRRRGKPSARSAMLIESAKHLSPRSYQKFMQLQASRASKDSVAYGPPDSLLDRLQAALAEDDAEHPGLEYMRYLRTVTHGRKRR